MDEYINKTEILFEMATSLIPQSMDITRAYAIAKDIIKKAPVADVAPVRKSTEEEKQNLKALFQDKEQYYKLSTLYNLGYEDDVNGNCDGKVDVGVVACLTSADVAPVRHGEWKYYTIGVHSYRECSVCGENSPYGVISRFCPNCGARMDGGKKMIILFVIMFLWVVFGCFIEIAIMQNKYDANYPVHSARFLYENTKMNWFGCWFCFILIRLLFPLNTICCLIIFIIWRICTFLFWLFTVGRKDEDVN